MFGKKRFSHGLYELRVPPIQTLPPTRTHTVSYVYNIHCVWFITIHIHTHARISIANVHLHAHIRTRTRQLRTEQRLFCFEETATWPGRMTHLVNISRKRRAPGLAYIIRRSTIIVIIIVFMLLLWTTCTAASVYIRRAVAIIRQTSG